MASGKPVKLRHDPEDVEIGQKIRALRVAKGVSQATLAEGIGLTFQQVQKYERGANRISASRLQKVARILDTPITFFYGDTRPKKHDPDTGFALIQSKGAMRLLRAYSAISSGSARHALVILADALRDKGPA